MVLKILSHVVTSLNRKSYYSWSLTQPHPTNPRMNKKLKLCVCVCVLKLATARRRPVTAWRYRTPGSSGCCCGSIGCCRNDGPLRQRFWSSFPFSFHSFSCSHAAEAMPRSNLRPRSGTALRPPHHFLMTSNYLQGRTYRYGRGICRLFPIGRLFFRLIHRRRRSGWLKA